MFIETLDPADFDACGALWDLKNSPFAETFRRQSEAGTRVIFVCREAGELVGEIAIVTQTNDPDYTAPHRACLSHLLVKPSHRRRGIGGQLIDHALAVLRETGYREATVGVNKDNREALALYRRKGFTTVLFDGEDEDGAYYKLMRSL